MSNRPYNGLVKHQPGMPYTDNTTEKEGGEIQGPLLEERYGSEICYLPPTKLIEHRGRKIPMPIHIKTDVYQAVPGSPVTGLALESPGNPNEPRWVEYQRRFMLPVIKQGEINTLITGDRHLNPKYLNGNALLRHIILREQLHPNELAIVQSDPVLRQKMTTRSALTVSEYMKIYGPIVDKEDINFLPHCREGEDDDGNRLSWIPSLESALQEISRNVLIEKRRNGDVRPVVRVVEDFKTGLSPYSPPDAMGMNGNLIHSVIRNSYNGRSVDGKYHRNWKIVVVDGTCHEYSLEDLIKLLVDLGFIVIVLMPGVGGLGASALINSAYRWVSRYGNNVFPTWDWIGFYGPKPQGYDAFVTIQRAMMFEEAFGPAGSADRMALDVLARQFAGRDNVSMEIAELLNKYAQKRYDGEELFYTWPQLLDRFEEVE